MNKETFHSEILEIAKQREPLSDERMARVTKRVFDNVDSMYGLNDIPNYETRPSGFIERIKAALTFDSERRTVGPLVVAFGVLSLVAVGSLLFKMTTNTQHYLEMPSTLADIGLHRYVDIPAEGGRAFVAVQKSEERLAFLAGIIQADLDIVGKNDSQLSSALVDWYYREAGFEGKTIQANEFAELVSKYNQDDIRGDWFKEGYAIEVLQVSANRSVDADDRKPVIAAIRYYQNLTGSLNNVVFEGEYKTHRDSLIDFATSEIADAAELKSLARITYEMKLYNQ